MFNQLTKSMKKRYIINFQIGLILAFIGFNTMIECSAQVSLNRKEKRIYNEAYKYARGTNNRRAASMFRQLYEKNPNDIDVAYNLGLCYVNGSLNPDSALFFLSRVEELDDGEWHEARTDLKFAIARIYQLKYEFDKALAIYDEIEKNDDSSETVEKIFHEREVCATAKQLVANPVRLSTRLLENSINSDYNDYRPVVSADMQTLIFTSRRREALERPKYQDGQYEEKLYTSSRNADGKWGKAKQMDLIKHRGAQQTAVSVSDAMGELYLCSDGDIYISRRDTATGQWQPAKPLEGSINSKAEEKFASISSDGQELYFSSNRDGGFGGFDIYRSFRLPNGKWGEPRNLGEVINTEFDEDAPVIHPSKPLLYFCSQGHNTMGGSDIFYSELNADSTFSPAVNIGYPINTPDDDLYFVPTAKKNFAYYASIQWIEGHSSGYNIYEVEYDEPEINRLVLVKGKVVSSSPSGVRITARANGEIVGTYMANERNGDFVMLLNENQNYEIYAESYDTTVVQRIQLQQGEGYNLTGQKRSLEDFVFNDQEEDTNDAEQYASASAGSDNDNGENNLPKGKFTVQILSMKRPVRFAEIGLDEKQLYEISYKDGWIVYSYGSYDKLSEARAVCENVKQSTPFSDAFVRNSDQYLRFVK